MRNPCIICRAGSDPEASGARCRPRRAEKRPIKPGPIYLFMFPGFLDATAQPSATENYRKHRKSAKIDLREAPARPRAAPRGAAHNAAPRRGLPEVDVGRFPVPPVSLGWQCPEPRLVWPSPFREEQHRTSSCNSWPRRGLLEAALADCRSLPYPCKLFYNASGPEIVDF